ncbi:MAG: GNAT family N-acetyltransferase [Eubacteriales bacterium]|nr:GNAT family N-acetyltransferase [Eubacteriales bacterium]
MIDTAFRYCQRSPLIHMDMSEAIRRGKANILYAADDGLLIFDTIANNLLLSCQSEQSAKKLCGLIDKSKCYSMVVRGEGALEVAMDKFAFSHNNTCYQCAYLKHERLPVQLEDDVRALELRFIPQILEHYHTVTDPKYFEERIGAGEMFGLFKKGTDELMGFVGLHDDGSGGMLEIFPQHRRHGLGAGLESYIINVQLDRGYTPYGQIFCDNDKSIALQKKLGLEVSTEVLHWIF